MIDTINIAHLISKFDFEKLLSLGWEIRRTETEAYLTFKDRKGSGFPYLYLFISPISEIFLGVAVSLPAFYHGSNVKLLSQREVIEALERLSVYVKDKSGIEFNAKTAMVWNVDFAIDTFIGENAVYPSVERLSKMKIPRFTTGKYEHTTLYFHSCGSQPERKKKRSICIYGKKKACIDKHFSQADIETADGILRCESRYRHSKAVTRLAKKLGVKKTAEELFTDEVAQNVLGQIISQINMLKNDASTREKIDKLKEIFGCRKSRALICFLIMRDTYGADFYKQPSHGYSRSSYFAFERKCRSCGIWSLTDVKHAPIEIDEIP